MFLAEFTPIRPEFGLLFFSLVVASVSLIGVVALIDIIRSDFRNKTTKNLWILMIHLFWGVAGVCYFISRKELLKPKS